MEDSQWPPGNGAIGFEASTFVLSFPAGPASVNTKGKAHGWWLSAGGFGCEMSLGSS